MELSARPRALGLCSVPRLPSRAARVAVSVIEVLHRSGLMTLYNGLSYSVRLSASAGNPPPSAVRPTQRPHPTTADALHACHWLRGHLGLTTPAQRTLLGMKKCINWHQARHTCSRGRSSRAAAQAGLPRPPARRPATLQGTASLQLPYTGLILTGHHAAQHCAPEGIAVQGSSQPPAALPPVSARAAHGARELDVTQCSQSLSPLTQECFHSPPASSPDLCRRVPPKTHATPRGGPRWDCDIYPTKQELKHFTTGPTRRARRLPVKASAGAAGVCAEARRARRPRPRARDHGARGRRPEAAGWLHQTQQPGELLSWAAARPAPPGRIGAHAAQSAPGDCAPPAGIRLSA
jgi:hypothetical protein